MTHTADIRILNGLPVTVQFTVQSAEPDVGIFSAYAEEYHVTHVGTRPYNGTWIETRIDATPGEDQRIKDDLDQLAFEEDDGYDEDDRYYYDP